MQTQEVAVAPSLRVILKSDSEILDEVTVIAYGTAKKNSLTGSVATIKSSDMEKLPVTSFEKALQGLSPGLQIASVSGQPFVYTGTYSWYRVYVCLKYPTLCYRWSCY